MGTARFEAPSWSYTLSQRSLVRMSVPELVDMHGAVLDELRSHRAIRSYNNPGADYAEMLFCRTFGWIQETASKAGYDAVDDDGARYQIKCRRITAWNRSRQLSAMRDLDLKRFDHLAVLPFDERYDVQRAAIIPHALIAGPLVRYSEYVRASIMRCEDQVWSWPGVEDVTTPLRETIEALRTGR